MLVFTLIYFAGIASCGIQGAQKTNCNIPYMTHPMMLEFFSAFGGGLIRDLFFLNVYPVAFTMECVPDITIALAAGTMYLWMQKEKHIHKVLLQLTVVADAFGLGTFIAIGADKAIGLEVSILTVFLCSVTTSLGGGVLSSALCGVELKTVFTTNVLYRLTAVIGSILYPFWVKVAGTDAAHIVIVIYTSIAALACNPDIRAYIAKSILTLPKVSSFNTYWMLLIVLTIKVQHDHTVGSKYIPQILHQPTTYLYRRKAIVLTLHRIRQM